MLDRMIIGIALSIGAGVATAQDLGIRPLPSTPKLGAHAEALGTTLAVPSTTTTNPSAAPLPIEERWRLTAGQTVGQNLRSWANRSNWNVVWQLPKDWIVPAPATFAGAFPDAAANVIETLAANGALIRAHIYYGNRTLVVSGPVVSQN